jgi:hypothetical protein
VKSIETTNEKLAQRIPMFEKHRSPDLEAVEKPSSVARLSLQSNGTRYADGI